MIIIIIIIIIIIWLFLKLFLTKKLMHDDCFDFSVTDFFKCIVKITVEIFLPENFLKGCCPISHKFLQNILLDVHLLIFSKMDLPFTK